jgi:predicted amidophosphoribosyltransferase
VSPVLLAAVVDLVLPRLCLGCGVAGSALCRRCLPGAPRAVLDEPVPGLPVLAGAAYGGAVRRAVLAFKERGRRDLVGTLGLVLGRTVAALMAGLPREATVLVAVPSSRSAAAARGGDHVLRLARRAAVVSGVRVAPGVLQLGRAVQDSAGLGRRGREQNLHGALRARAPTGGRAGPRRAIVVDDIVTTGATLREAVRALRAAGRGRHRAAPRGGRCVPAVTVTARHSSVTHWQGPVDRSSVRTT